MHRSDGMMKENAQHVRNRLTNQRGMRKVLKSAVLEGTISARMPAPLTPMELMMESCRAERPRHDKRKYPALNAQVSNKAGYGLRFCGVLGSSIMVNLDSNCKCLQKLFRHPGTRQGDDRKFRLSVKSRRRIASSLLCALR